MPKKVSSYVDKDLITPLEIQVNSPKDVLKHIKNLQTASDIMTKLKEFYKGSENADIQLLMDKLYSLKTKGINDCKDVINEIKEIFSSLEKHRTYLGKLEKLRILYRSFSVDLKIRLQPRGNEDVENFIKEAFDILNFSNVFKKETQDILL